MLIRLSSLNRYEDTSTKENINRKLIILSKARDFANRPKKRKVKLSTEKRKVYFNDGEHCGASNQ